MSRRPLIAGNWKMNKTASEGAALVREIATLLARSPDACGAGPEVLVCPPFTALGAAAEAARGTCLAVGAQNVHWAANGAFTGEVSAAMLAAVPVTHVLVGHSERRQFFGETDQTVNQRAHAAVAGGLTAVICVGETLAERESGHTHVVVGRQTRAALEGLGRENMAHVVLAYEPVWAIGTGRVATDEQAQEVHAFLRGLLRDLHGAETAEATRILYGGSMKPENAAALLAKPDIDGGLIGGASLKAVDFVAIVRAAG